MEDDGHASDDLVSHISTIESRNDRFAEEHGMTTDTE